MQARLGKKSKASFKVKVLKVQPKGLHESASAGDNARLAKRRQEKYKNMLANDCVLTMLLYALALHASMVLITLSVTSVRFLGHSKNRALIPSFQMIFVSSILLASAMGAFPSYKQDDSAIEVSLLGWTHTRKYAAGFLRNTAGDAYATVSNLIPNKEYYFKVYQYANIALARRTVKVALPHGLVVAETTASFLIQCLVLLAGVHEG